MSRPLEYGCAGHLSDPQEACEYCQINNRLFTAARESRVLVAPVRGWAAEERRINRTALTTVLDRNFEEAGIKITVGRHNKILTDLGYHLDEPPNTVLGDTPKT